MKAVLTCVAILALSACSQSSNDERGQVDERASELVPTPADNDPGDAPPSQAAYDGPIPSPIKVGSDGPDMDACGSYAEVGDLSDTEDGFLYVHDAPSAETKARHRFSQGQGVAVCQTQNGFSGVVYPGEGQTLSDCGTGSPVATEQNYTGPCRAGWVESRFLEMIAG